MSGGDGLFEVDPAAVAEPGAAPKAPAKKRFRAFVPDQLLLLPPSLDKRLPEGHLAPFVAELVDEALDLSPILASYTDKRGFPPYDPRLMVRLLIYGYTTGVRSSRAMERKCVDDGRFRCLAAGAGPDYRSISRFRARAPGRPGRDLHPVAAPGASSGHGEDGPGRAGRHEAGGERLQAQGGPPPGAGRHRGSRSRGSRRIPRRRRRAAEGQGRRQSSPTRIAGS